MARRQDRGRNDGRDASDEAGDEGAPGDDRQRLDKWLWFARFARTRTAAQALVTGGRVRINRERITNAARAVRAGDVITVALGQHVRVVRITAFAERRGGAEDASRLYDDLAPRVAPAGAEEEDEA